MGNTYSNECDLSNPETAMLTGPDSCYCENVRRENYYFNC